MSHPLLPGKRVRSGAEVRGNRGPGGNIEHRGGGALATRCGGTAGDSEKVDQLVLHGDHGFRGGDPIGGRGGHVFHEVSHSFG